MKIERFNTVVEIETSSNGNPPDKQDTGEFITQGFARWIRIDNRDWIKLNTTASIESLTEALTTCSEGVFKFTLDLCIASAVKGSPKKF